MYKNVAIQVLLYEQFLFDQWYWSTLSSEMNLKIYEL